jgi:predicted DNA-binding protein YlxM (UPF0122 family)
MGAVYFLKQKNQQPIKIGYSKEKNPLRRVNSYKTYFPFGLEFLGYVSFNNVIEAIEFEKECHNYFNFNKINKEWFLINEDMINKFISNKGYELLKNFKETKQNKDLDIYNLFISKKINIKEIADYKKVSVQYVYRVLKNKNVAKRNTDKQNEIINLYKNGNSIKEISKDLKVSVQYIYKVLNKLCKYT